MKIRLDLEHEKPKKSIRLTILTSDLLNDDIIPVLASRVHQAFQACPKAYGKRLGLHVIIPMQDKKNQLSHSPLLKIKSLVTDPVIQCIIRTFDLTWDISFGQKPKSLDIQIEPLIKKETD